VRRYLIKRLAAAGIVVAGVSVIVFLVLHLVPGDPAQIVLGPMGTKTELQRLRTELGLDHPLHVQYLRWIGRVVQGDLGRSIAWNRPVLPEVLQRFRATLVLAGTSLTIATAVGILFGIVSAVRQRSWADRIVTLLAVVGISMPSFWLGMVLVALFSVKLGWLPVSGMYDVTGSGGTADLIRHLILPAITLAVIPMAVITRVTRSNMLEVIRHDYIRTARSKGVAERTVILRHAFRNTMVNMITVVGMQAGFLLAGAIYVERVFAWPGVGSMMVDGILKRDFPVIQGGILLVALSYVTINLLTDVTYAYLDPRIRYD
jgi:peptide/nickel transport system permease protein